MSIETVRLSERAKTQLITMKRRTGIQQWNILCRWAFCLSLAEPSAPPDEDIPANSNVEMTWRTFAGRHETLLLALVRHRHWLDHGGQSSRDQLDNTLRLHIHRGISYLTSYATLSDLLHHATSEVPDSPL